MADWVDEIEQQMDETVPYYVPRLIAEIRTLRRGVIERTAQLSAHRACVGAEHDPFNGKLHGYCVVCGVAWPCAYAGSPPHTEEK